MSSAPISGCGPIPGSTPLAIPVEAALTYYEGAGRTGSAPR